MDNNLKLPAYPSPIALDQIEGRIFTLDDPEVVGLSKLEKASLMAMQGMLASGKWNAEDFYHVPYNPDVNSPAYEHAVRCAKAVLEEANK